MIWMKLCKYKKNIKIFMLLLRLYHEGVKLLANFKGIQA